MRTRAASRHRLAKAPRGPGRLARRGWTLIAAAAKARARACR